MSRTNIISSFIAKLGLVSLVFFIYTAIAIVIYKHRLIDVSPFTHYSMPDVDTDATLWYLWVKSQINAENTPFKTIHYLSYPYGYDMTIAPFFNIFDEVRIFFYESMGGGWHNLIFIINISAFLAHPLTGVSMFLLAYYLTKNRYASFLAGLIFGFSAYLVLMGRGSMSNNHFWLIPIFYLSIFYFLDSKKPLAVIGSGVALAIQFAINAYWAFFAAIFAPIVFLLYADNLSLKERVRLFTIFLGSSAIFWITINYQLIVEQIYLFTQPDLGDIARTKVPARASVNNVLASYAPAHENIVYPWGISAEGTNYPGYVAMMAAIIAGLMGIIGKRKDFAMLMICYLFAVLLCSYVPGLFWINELYFQYLGTFRGVGRFAILAIFFIALLTALLTNHYYKQYLNSSSLFAMPNNTMKLTWAFIILILPVLIVAEGYTTQGTFLRTNDFSQMAKLYAPIKNDPSVKAIAGYPMTYSSGDWGAPPLYEYLGQIVHQKPLAGGLDLRHHLDQRLLNTISDISDINAPGTIDKLIKRKVDTIIIYNDIQPNAKSIVAALKHDSRIHYQGRYKVPHDKAGYLSQNDLSRDISVFRVKALLARAP